MSPKNEDRYQKIYNEIDRDKDGFIDKNEIVNALKQASQDTTYNEIKVPNIEHDNNIQNRPANIHNFKDGMFIRYI